MEVLVLIGFVALIFVIRYVISASVNKAGDVIGDAISNRVRKAQEEKNPPKKQSLADLYGNQTDKTDQ